MPQSKPRCVFCFRSRRFADSYEPIPLCFLFSFSQICRWEFPKAPSLEAGHSQSPTSWVPEESNCVFCFRSRRFVDGTFPKPHLEAGHSQSQNLLSPRTVQLCFRSRRFVDPTSKWEPRLHETVDPGTPAFYSRHSQVSHNLSKCQNSQLEVGERLLEFLTREHRFRSLSSRIVILESTTESPNSLPGTGREHQNWSSPRVCCSTRRILSISWNSGVSKVISLDLLWG